MYTIGEVSKLFNISIHTLRFYDREGLFINLKRDKSGKRNFDDSDLEAIRLIECLKKSGMKIKDIKEFMYWCSLGNETLEKRKKMFYKQRENIIKEINELKKVLSMIEYKCWYYEQALKDGNEDRLKNISMDNIPENIPENIKNFFIQAHL